MIVYLLVYYDLLDGMQLAYAQRKMRHIMTLFVFR